MKGRRARETLSFGAARSRPDRQGPAGRSPAGAATAGGTPRHRNVRRRPPAFGVALGAAHQRRRRTVRFLNDIGHLQRHQLAPAQQRVVGDREERAVARVDEAIARDLEQALAQRSGEPPGLLLTPSLSPVHAL